MNCIVYGEGYRYQLREDYRVLVEVLPDAPIVTPWIELDAQGWLTIRAGYAWDGPSGPAIDTPSFMRASLVHDALYQLMRERLLHNVRHRGPADRALHRICIEDGMWRVRAWWCYQAVRLFADPAADPARAAPDKRAGCGCSDPPLPT